jgi:hypothetical protein
LIALTLTFGTALFKYATTFYGHALAGFLFFAAFFIWRRQKDAVHLSPFWIYLSGFLLGFLVITEYPAAALVPILGGYVLFILRRRRELRNWKVYGLLAAGAFLPVGLLLFYNYACFGNPFTPGYSYESMQRFQTAHATGLFGIGLPDPKALFYITLHPGMGIFWQSPFLLLAIPGGIALVRSREHAPEGIFAVTAILVYLVFCSGYYAWGGAYTPRHIIPILPLFVLPLAVLPRKWMPAALAAAVISIAQHFLATSGGFGFSTDPNRGILVYDMFLPNFLADELTNNRGMQWFGLEGKTSLIPLFMIQGALLAAFFALGRQCDRSKEKI